MDRSGATTPALAEAAARSELTQLKGALADKQAELDALRAERDAAAPASHTAPVLSAATPRGTLGLAVGAALIVGFWLGYATLARRVRQKFGGIKVY
jgi:predicted phage tail protein